MKEKAENSWFEGLIVVHERAKMTTEQGKVIFHHAQGWLLKSESDTQPRHGSGHPLVLVPL